MIGESAKDIVLKRKIESELMKDKVYVVKNDELEFEKEWNKRLRVAEYNFSSAMNVVDEEKPIDYNLDLNA